MKPIRLSKYGIEIEFGREEEELLLVMILTSCLPWKVCILCPHIVLFLPYFAYSDRALPTAAAVGVETC